MTKIHIDYLILQQNYANSGSKDQISAIFRGLYQTTWANGWKTLYISILWPPFFKIVVTLNCFVVVGDIAKYLNDRFWFFNRSKLLSVRKLLPTTFSRFFFELFYVYIPRKSNCWMKLCTSKCNVETIFSNFSCRFQFPMILTVLFFWMWETSRKKLKKHSVTRNCSDFSLFE